MKTFEKAVEWAKSGEFTQEDIDEAKLAVFAAVDAPIAPSDKGTFSPASQHWDIYLPFIFKGEKIVC